MDGVDVLALLVTSGTSTDQAPASGRDPADGISLDERRRRLAEADAELEEVSKRLGATPRTELARALRPPRAEGAHAAPGRANGGKTWLSGSHLASAASSAWGASSTAGCCRSKLSEHRQAEPARGEALRPSSRDARAEAVSAGCHVGEQGKMSRAWPSFASYGHRLPLNRYPRGACCVPP
jgi:hypothetical protein